MINKIRVFLKHLINIVLMGMFRKSNLLINIFTILLAACILIIQFGPNVVSYLWIKGLLLFIIIFMFYLIVQYSVTEKLDQATKLPHMGACSQIDCIKSNSSFWLSL